MIARCVLPASFLCAVIAGASAEEPPAETPVVESPFLEAPTVEPKRRDGPPGGTGFGGPGMGAPGYGATWYPSRPVSGTNEGFSLVRQQLSVGAPIWMEDGRRVTLNASVRNTLFLTDALLPDSGQAFPNELWNVTVGVNYHHQFENGWSGSLGVNVGSASDKPFHSIDEMTFGLLGFVRIPVKNDRDAWLLSVMYSPVSNFNFPIPGVAYAWNPSERFQVNIGLPFFLTWQPTDDWTLNLSYIPVTNVSARATYRLHETLFAYAGFEWLYEAYFLADRDERRDRFIAFEKRLIGGVRWDITQKASLDINGGYAFDREYGIGQNTLGNLSDQIDIASGAFLGAQFRMRY